jgi:hypothetical protein
MNGENRGPWYLLTGLVIGIALGLIYAWIFQPVKYIDTSPSSLRSDFKDQYRALIAAAYLGNGDLLRARARLELLKDGDMFRALSEQAQRTLAQQGSDADARALGLLAIALGQAPPGPAIAITQQRLSPLAQPTRTEGFNQPNEAPLPGVIQLTATSTAIAIGQPTQPPDTEPTTLPPSDLPTNSSLATVSPISAGSSTPPQTDTPPMSPAITATPGGPFILLSQEKVCDQQLEAPQLQIEALDRFNRPVPGVLVIVAWAGGEEQFFTGLKPEKGQGYADFTLTPGTLYNLQLGVNGERVTDLAGLMCTPDSGAPYWGAWLLKFVQP